MTPVGLLRRGKGAEKADTLPAFQAAPDGVAVVFLSSEAVGVKQSRL